MGENWLEAKRELVQRPDQAKSWTFIQVDKSKKGVFFPVLPLHQAIINRAPMELIKALVQAYPKAVAKKDSHFERYPLHFACLYSPYPELVSYLVELGKNDVAISSVDRLGRLPLHYATFGRACEYVVRLLAGAYPDGVRHQDINGWLPLHVAVRHNCSFGAVEWLARVHPQGLQVKTRTGMTPRDVAQKYSSVADKKTRALLGGTVYEQKRSTLLSQDASTPQILHINANAA
jgi:ankyrin repeat protein